MRAPGSFLIVGVMLLALFGATAAQAQIAVPAVSSVGPAGQMKLFVTWTWGSADGGDNTGAQWQATKFEVRYEQVDGASEYMFPGVSDMIKDAAETARSYTIEGLKHSKRYIVSIRAHGEFTGTTGDATETGEGVSGWSVVDQNAGVGSTPTATKPGKVTDLELTAGDGQIMATWDEPDGKGFDITGYELMITPKDGATDVMNVGPMEDYTFTGLMNGTEYEIQVAGRSSIGLGTPSDEKKATPMADATPTPALPIFGAFALGAGLLAAGRRRLRRRQQLLNS